MCAIKHEQLLENESFVDRARGIIGEAGGDVAVDGRKAWRRLCREMDMGKSEHKEVVFIMKSKYKKAVAALATGAALFTLFSFAPVRATAADLLKIFRVDKIQTIAIDPADMRQLEDVLRKQGGKADIRNFGAVESSGHMSTSKVSLEEARKAVDFPLSLPADAPAGYTAPVYTRLTGTEVSFNLNAGNINSTIKALGGDKFLPAELNGKTFTLKVPNAVTAEYKSADGSKTLFVGESKSPEIQVPSGVDENAVRDALLSIPVLPENLRSQLAAINDWQHTLLIPSIDGSTTEVAVNGSQGVFMQSPAGNYQHGDQNGQGSAGRQINSLIWQDNGVIHIISGEALSQEQAAAVASAMK